MTKFTWMKVGATWSENIRDNSTNRTREAVATYRVLTEPGPEGGGEIERTTKGRDDDDTSTFTPEDLASEGALLNADPEQSELVEINGEAYFMERTENIPVDVGSRGAYKLIRKFRGDCPHCYGNSGCEDCSGSGQCSECGDSGNCGNCSGEGKCTNCDGERKCYNCEGSGRCQSCEGRGRYDDGAQCDECQGSGKCQECSGSGNCSDCNGTGRCGECAGSGKCGICHGSGRCTSCNGSLKCRDCGGIGKAKVSEEYWFDMATGIMLRYTRSINDKVVIMRNVSQISVSVTPMSARSVGMSSSSEVYTQPVTVTPTPPPLTYNQPMRVPEVCPTCRLVLRPYGNPVFCPKCKTRLLQ